MQFITRFTWPGSKFSKLLPYLRGNHGIYVTIGAHTGHRIASTRNCAAIDATRGSGLITINDTNNGRYGHIQIYSAFRNTIKNDVRPIYRSICKSEITHLIYVDAHFLLHRHIYTYLVSFKCFDPNLWLHRPGITNTRRNSFESWRNRAHTKMPNRCT